jgi:hypothetical protein
MATYPTPPNQGKRKPKRTMSESSAGQRKRTPKDISDYAIRPKRTPKGNAMPAIWYRGRGGGSAVAIKPAYKNPLKKGSSARTIKPARRPRQMGR